LLFLIERLLEQHFKLETFSVNEGGHQTGNLKTKRHMTTGSTTNRTVVYGRESKRKLFEGPPALPASRDSKSV